MKEPQTISVQTLELKPDEPLTLPETFKSALGLDKGGTYTAIQLNGLVLLISRSLIAQEALEGMRKVLEAKGVTLEDLLSGLSEVRSQVLYERYSLAS
ncbi:MAG TPA: hypothetical protein ENG33_04960 [Chloroflexi bacterium]|nr:hypothetical protein [Chloroflexota bacterium]